MRRQSNKQNAGTDEGAEAPGTGEVPAREVLEQTLAQLEAEQERYLRLAAEFDNFRKRTERDMAEYKRRATDDILLSLLQVIDNLDRALSISDGSGPAALVGGLRAIRVQMGAIVEREGIEAIEAMGIEFDPFEMEAVMMMPSPDVAEGHVLRELAKGYRGCGYVLRPSKVVVSSGPQGQSPEVAGDDAACGIRPVVDIDARK
jgi:molecular chaperone GrpE